MKVQKWTVGFALLATALGGCTLPRPDKAGESSVSLDIVPTAVASVSEARAVHKGEELTVSGKVKKYHKFFLPGHVDIVVCDAQGNMMAEATPRLTGYASKRGGVKEGRFSTQMRLTPSPGSTVRVKYHAPSSREKHLECPLKNAKQEIRRVFTARERSETERNLS